MTYHGCNFNLIHNTNNGGSTALEEACYADNINEYIGGYEREQVIRFLIDEIKIPITPRAIHNIIYSEPKFVKLLLDKGGDPNDVYIMSPLLMLINGVRIRNEIIEIITLLLQYGDDILMTDGYIGNSLHLASNRGHIQIVDLLLDHAMEQNKLKDLLLPSPNECRICKGKNAHQIALEYKHYELAVILEGYFPNSGFDDL